MTITNAFRAAAASLGVPTPKRTHQNTKIVACNMNEVALVDVFTTAKPCAAHTAAFENMTEAALDHLAALAHRVPESFYDRQTESAGDDFVNGLLWTERHCALII